MFDAHDEQSLPMAGGGLDNIVVLMEGESLFNDATSIVLFEIFFEMVKKIGEGKPGMDGTFAQEGVHILGQIAWLTAGNPSPPPFLCHALLHASLHALLLPLLTVAQGGRRISRCCMLCLCHALLHALLLPMLDFSTTWGHIA